MSAFGDDVVLRYLSEAGNDVVELSRATTSVTREQVPDVAHVLLEVDAFVVTVHAVRRRRYTALCDHAVKQTYRTQNGRPPAVTK